jgi:hypothetical protein
MMMMAGRASEKNDAKKMRNVFRTNECQVMTRTQEEEKDQAWLSCQLAGHLGAH